MKPGASYKMSYNLPDVSAKCPFEPTVSLEPLFLALVFVMDDIPVSGRILPWGYSSFDIV